MAIFDEDIKLPGVVTEIINEYATGYDTSLFGTTDEVLIIGTAFNGPVGKVVPIYNPEYARYMYGQAYDAETRREAYLVSAIQDAWDRGCRTIYGCRVSGKEIYKDYQLMTDTNLKLRVSGAFPSNTNKDVYMTFENDGYDITVTIYKPSERATIAEKKKGVVESTNSVVVNKIDISGSGLTVDDDITQLISAVNKYVYNNVLTLAIVDENGNDVTLSSIDAKSIKVGDMFSGIYTIGRDANAIGVAADTKLSVVFDEKPYNSFDGIFYKKLTLNTNVAVDLPLYSADNNLNEILGISSINEYDFLSVVDGLDQYFLKDKTDYEEVDLSAFDLYQKLGSGYAINAGITIVEKNGKKRVRVKEITDKANRKSEISNGIYSTLENVPYHYRVLTGAYADQEIKGVLPKADDFKFAKVKNLKLLNDSVSISSLVKSDDLSESKTYNISFASLTDDEVKDLEDIKDNLYKDKTIREVTILDFTDLTANSEKQYKEGSLFLVKGATSTDFLDTENLLYTFNNGEFVSLHSFDTDTKKDLLKDSIVYADNKLYICNKEVTSISDPNLKFTSFVEVTSVNDLDPNTTYQFVIISVDNKIFQIAKLEEKTSQVPDPSDPDPSNPTLPLITVTSFEANILGTIDQILSEDEDKVLTAITNGYGVNNITIKSNEFDFLTIDEVVDILNNDKDFKQILKIETIDILKAQESIQDMKDDDVDGKIKFSGEFVDKEISWDTTKLIPFRTDDNFARHLAQHCTYTSLKTAPTHGIIGTKVLLDTNVDSITNRVNELVALNLSDSLVARKGNGANMLDRNNMPYPIGRKVSIVVSQYNITDDEGYTSISNAAAGYAGMVSCLALDQSSTCQTIDCPDLSFELTNYQLGLLTNAGFVTIKDSYSKGWVITDGITMAPADSPYKRLSASRIADAIEELIREVCEPYIGKQNNLSNRNSLSAALKSKLDTIKGTLINSYQFNLILDNASTQLGIITIDYSIVPIYEIKEIKNNIKITE
jgi:hypothetical protein